MIKPCRVSESAQYEFGSFVLARVCPPGLFLQWVGLFFMQEDPALLVYLTCKDPAGQVSALPTLSPGTRHRRQQCLLPSALPNPHAGMGRCPSPHGQIRCSHSHRELRGSASGEEVGASPQSHPRMWAVCKPQPHPAPILTPSPLVTLQSGTSPNSLFLSSILLFAHSAE